MRVASMVICVAGVPFEVGYPEGAVSVTRALAPYETSEPALFSVGPDAPYEAWARSVVPGRPEEEYLHSGLLHQVALGLLPYGCLLLHAAVVAVDGRAYAFAAPSGTGKSTHVGLWMRHFGGRARVVNGDKPILRRRDGAWLACAAPWAGKENWQTRMDVPLAGICFLERGDGNAIRPLGEREETDRLFAQLDPPGDPALTDAWLHLVGELVREVPSWQLTCTISAEAARLSYGAMSGRDDWDHGE